MKLERADSDCYRIMDGERIAAFALRLATGKWGAYASDYDTRLGSKFAQFDKPRDVLAFVVAKAAGEVAKIEDNHDEQA